MAELQLGVPIEIDGEEVIIFRDVIGTDALTSSRESEIFTIVEERGADGRPPIYIDETELRNLREAYPGINVYGLWQLLFANDMVPLGNEVVLFPTGPGSGIYLRMAPNTDWHSPANIYQSSEFVENFIPELLEYDLDQANRLVVDTESLRLPSAPAFTRIELFEKQKHEQTKRWYVVATICVIMAAATAVYNYAMHSVYKMNMAEYGNKKQLSLDLDTRIAGLLKERLQTLPDNSATLDRIDSLLSYEPKLRTPADGSALNGFNAAHVFFTRPGYPVDLTSKVPGVIAEITPKLEYKLTLSTELGMEVGH